MLTDFLQSKSTDSIEKSVPILDHYDKREDILIYLKREYTFIFAWIRKQTRLGNFNWPRGGEKLVGLIR